EKMRTDPRRRPRSPLSGRAARRQLLLARRLGRGYPFRRSERPAVPSGHRGPARSVPVSASPPSRQRPDYGLDAPPVVLVLLLVGGAALAAAVVLHLLEVPHPGGVPVREIGLVLGVNCLLNAGGMVWYSKVRKARARERFLDLVPWRGDEAVLD